MKYKNAIIESILTRTSVRNYTKEPVEDEDLTTILKAAMSSPTAVNIQPWSFIVIKDTARLKRLGEILSLCGYDILCRCCDRSLRPS